MSENTKYYGFVDVTLAVPFSINLENTPIEYEFKYDYAVEQFKKQFSENPEAFLKLAFIHGEPKVDDYLQITD